MLGEKLKIKGKNEDFWCSVTVVFWLTNKCKFLPHFSLFLFQFNNLVKFLFLLSSLYYPPFFLFVWLAKRKFFLPTILHHLWKNLILLKFTENIYTQIIESTHLQFMNVHLKVFFVLEMFSVHIELFSFFLHHLNVLKLFTVLGMFTVFRSNCSYFFSIIWMFLNCSLHTVLSYYVFIWATGYWWRHHKRVRLLLKYPPTPPPLYSHDHPCPKVARWDR